MANDARRVAGDDGSGGYLTCYHRARADDRARADTNALEDRHVTGNPGISADMCGGAALDA